MIDPRGLSVQQWFDAVISDTTATWAFGRFDGDWRAYAVGFVRAPPFAQRNLPDPYQFSQWEDWAMRAAIMLENR